RSAEGHARIAPRSAFLVAACRPAPPELRLTNGVGTDSLTDYGDSPGTSSRVLSGIGELRKAIGSRMTPSGCHPPNLAVHRGASQAAPFGFAIIGRSKSLADHLGEGHEPAEQWEGTLAAPAREDTAGAGRAH